MSKIIFIMLLALTGAGIMISAVILLRDDWQDNSANIVYVSKNADTSDFWQAMIAGANMAAKEYEVDFTVLALEQEEEYEKQNALIMEAIQMEPDAILLSPADYEQNLEAAKQIKAENIKLVLIDSVLKEDIADAVVATNNEKAGALMGQQIVEAYGQQAVIGIVSHVKGSSTAIEREEGLRTGLGDIQNNIVDVVFSDSVYSKAYDVTKEMLWSHPEITVLVALNEYSTVGAGRATKDMGRQDSVKIIGFDNAIEEIQMLESGVLDGIVVQKSFDMGYLGVKTAVSLVNREKVPRHVDSGTKLITKDDIFTEKNQKLLFPFWGEQNIKKKSK